MWLHNCLYLTHSKVFRSFIHVLTTALTSRFWKQSKTHLSITSSKQLLSFLNCKYSIYWFIWECISIGLNYPFSQVWFFSTFLMEILREKLLILFSKLYSVIVNCFSPEAGICSSQPTEIPNQLDWLASKFQGTKCFSDDLITTGGADYFSNNLSIMQILLFEIESTF